MEPIAMLIAAVAALICLIAIIAEQLRVEIERQRSEERRRQERALAVHKARWRANSGGWNGQSQLWDQPRRSDRTIGFDR